MKNNRENSKRKLNRKQLKFILVFATIIFGVTGCENSKEELIYNTDEAKDNAVNEETEIILEPLIYSKLTDEREKEYYWLLLTTGDKIFQSGVKTSIYCKFVYDIWNLEIAYCKDCKVNLETLVKDKSVLDDLNEEMIDIQTNIGILKDKPNSDFTESREKILDLYLAYYMLLDKANNPSGTPEEYGRSYSKNVEDLLIYHEQFDILIPVP